MIVESLFASIDGSYLYVFYALVSAALIYVVLTSEQGLHSGFPTADINEKGWFWRSKARDAWLRRGKSILDEGLRKFPSCFQVFTATGPKLVLPNKFADEIRNNPHMDFTRAIEKEFLGQYPGFEPFRATFTSSVITDTVRGRLTQSLNFITEELSDETEVAIGELFGYPEEWTEVTYKGKLLDLVARVSSRVFVGEELCTNEAWLKISKDYTIDSFIAMRALREWPSVLRPIVHWFLPECQKIRAELKEARKILAPVVEARRKRNRKAREAGETPSKVADTIGWLDDASKGCPYDIALAQLGLSFAAIHTTTELVSGILSDLCANPQYFEPLREEMTRVLVKKGWAKSSLQELKLMDSLMKESQRHHFGDIAAMNRITTKQVTLTDGTVIPPNALTMVSIDRMYDESIFPNPHAFNGYRFYNMRQQPGNANRWQFVTTSPEHLAFGHGKHSCPGRFFAGNEIKVVLIHLLNKFEWKFTSEGRKEDQQFGQESEIDPASKALFRTRPDAMAL